MTPSKKHNPVADAQNAEHVSTELRRSFIRMYGERKPVYVVQLDRTRDRNGNSRMRVLFLINDNDGLEDNTFAVAMLAGLTVTRRQFKGRLSAYVPASGSGVLPYLVALKLPCVFKKIGEHFSPFSTNL